MLFAEQVRAARSLLAWKQADLARSSGVGIATIQRIERKKKGIALGNVSTIVRIQEAFERAGIQFIEADSTGGIGLRLVHSKAKKQKSSMR
jgi:transcriptional regulator with XRE-family HTH domain